MTGEMAFHSHRFTATRTAETVIALKASVLQYVSGLIHSVIAVAAKKKELRDSIPVKT